MQKTLKERFDPYYIFDDEFASVPGAQLNQGRTYNDLQMVSEPFNVKNFYPELETQVGKQKGSVVANLCGGLASGNNKSTKNQGVPERFVKMLIASNTNKTGKEGASGCEIF